jgi:hypothetical protein
MCISGDDWFAHRSNRLRHVRSATRHDYIPLSSLPYGAYNTPPRSLMLCIESNAQSETIRGAVENLQVAMKDYKTLMTDSTASRIGTVVKIGAALAEVFLMLLSSDSVLHLTD